MEARNVQNMEMKLRRLEATLLKELVKSQDYRASES